MPSAACPGPRCSRGLLRDHPDTIISEGLSLSERMVVQSGVGAAA